jgi:replicative superfamily II helicase
MVILKLEEVKKLDELIHKYNTLEIKNQFLKQDTKRNISYDELVFMVESANLLALSTKYRNRDRALKIATIIPNITEEYELIIGCKVVLSKLKNFLAIKRLDELFPDYSNNSLSILEQLKQKYEVINNTVNILDKEVILNNIQYSIYELIKSNKDTSISAPTSAGKSYILMRAVIESLIKTNKNIVYLVPTRALINQVMEDLRGNMNDDKYFITSSSDIRNIKNGQVGIFVLTQERLYQLCNNRNVEIGTLIVDEAQNIMYGSRGVLLEYSIKYARNIWKNIRIIFLSPMIDNPTKLFEKFNDVENQAYCTKEYTVRQNILKLIRLEGRGYELKLNNRTIEEKIDITKGTTLAENVVNVYLHFNNGEKSIIYCNTPKMTQSICKKLYEKKIINEGDYDKKTTEDKGKERLIEFANFIERYIHKNYMLVKYIKRGIAFHYGSLPSFIRLGIENLAGDGLIHTIVSTSTLLQGINIPAQNIYICNPRKSKKDRLDKLDFWNLVGRAGRTGFDLNGNVILVDTPSWDNINNYDEKNIEVKYATELNESQIRGVENALKSDFYDSKDKEFIDSIESALIFDEIINKKNNSVLSSKVIQEYVKETVDKYDEIKELLIKLIGIRPQNIQRLWELFSNNDDDIESFLIPHPLKRNFFHTYIEILDIINTYIMDGVLYKTDPDVSFEENKSYRRLVFCSLGWMRGYSLKRILFHDFDNFNDEDKVTRQVQNQISYLNSHIRHKLIKGVYAYQEVLKEYLIRTKREHLVEKISNIAMFLELGACDDTSIELISLGLMRELALELISRFKFGNIDLVFSLKKLDLNDLDLSSYEINKIKDFIEKL